MKAKQCKHITLPVVRKEALLYEKMLPPEQRKRLGQFFTGLPLARLLAALSVQETCHAVIDPMAGSGDMLDAVMERCYKTQVPIDRIDGIEIDMPTSRKCQERLSTWSDIQPKIQQHILAGSAFDPSLINELKSDGYNLVITNPPYVRYQAFSQDIDSKGDNSSNTIRSALLDLVEYIAPIQEKVVWRELIKGYSGLSDLSVPSWLLSALLVREGGVLAVVAPATWRTRDYADILQYMLCRFFSVDAVIADTQPGWFSEALVRTHLVIATRLPINKACIPLRERPEETEVYKWVEIEPTARQADSLVGDVFQSSDPEGSFASWVFGEVEQPSCPIGLIKSERLKRDEIVSVLNNCSKSKWFKKVEPILIDAPLFGIKSVSANYLVPQSLADILRCSLTNLVNLTQLGINVGQGLRTGCNDFFYVDLLKQINKGQAKIKTSALFGGINITVPLAVLKPVLRRQSELDNHVSDKPLQGRLLDLRTFVLPEDYTEVEQAKHLYGHLNLEIPNMMPDELANYVRRAASTRREKESNGTLIPDLSAVKTNTRSAKSGSKLQIPRFWYMLPDFVHRHMPDAFVPRINQHTPSVIANKKPPILIDANFSTIWSDNNKWTVDSIVSMLNCSWVRACMEAIGTPMGGGALKLEATHLRKLPMPNLDKDKLHLLKSLSALKSSSTQEKIDHLIVGAVLHDKADDHSVLQAISLLHQFTEAAEKARQRGKP